jgi:hypothetical protein
MLQFIRLVLEVMGVAAIILAALWVRDDNSWEPKITLLVGLIAYGQSLLNRTLPPTKKHMKRDFLHTLGTYRSQWAAEKRLAPPELRTAKNIAKNIQWSLSHLREKLGQKFPTTEGQAFEDLLHDLRSIEEHAVYMDGGASYRAFWASGDAAITKVEAMVLRL